MFIEGNKKRNLRGNSCPLFGLWVFFCDKGKCWVGVGKRFLNSYPPNSHSLAPITPSKRAVEVIELAKVNILNAPFVFFCQLAIDRNGCIKLVQVIFEAEIEDLKTYTPK